MFPIVPLVCGTIIFTASTVIAVAAARRKSHEQWFYGTFWYLASVLSMLLLSLVFFSVFFGDDGKENAVEVLRADISEMSVSSDKEFEIVLDDGTELIVPTRGTEIVIGGEDAGKQPIIIQSEYRNNVLGTQVRDTKLVLPNEEVSGE